MRAAAAAAAIVVFVAGCARLGPPPRPVARVKAASTEVTFSVDGTTTYGTLDVPAHNAGQKLAAALLLAGSGPTDRDGNQPPGLTPDTLRQIAEALGRSGIMSLRFDKYFSGATGGGRYTTDPGSIDLAAFVKQAAAAYGFMAGQPDADPHSLLIVGHSEGGMYAMLLAARVSPAPAGLALVEPQDEHLLDLVALQLGEGLDAAVAQGTISTALAERNRTGIDRAISAFRAGATVRTSDLLPWVVTGLSPLLLSRSNAKYVRSDDAVDPASAAAKIPSGTRVLVTDGTSDTNVPPITIQPLIDGLTRAGTTGPGLVVLPGLDHFLTQSGSPPTGALLDPSFLAALKGWAAPYAPRP